MQRLFYGVAGEGLGHSSRAYAVIEQLTDFEVHIFTFGDAYEFFHKLGYPHLHLIQGIRFGRLPNSKKISTLRSIGNVLSFLDISDSEISKIVKLGKSLRPVAAISDFEPLLPRAGHQLRIPVISIDNQHKFSRCTSPGLSWPLRLYCFVAGRYTEALVTRPDHVIISTFYHDAVKKTYRNVHLTNIFVRKVLTDIQPTDQGHLLVYYKESVGPRMLRCLINCGYPVKVYGTDVVPEGMAAHKLSYVDFAKDLAGCHAVFCAAGNQLLGEAAFFGKPVFTVPEPNQQEQTINGHYIERLGIGTAKSLEDLTPEAVDRFLDQCQKMKFPRKENGALSAATLIRKFVQ